MYSSGSARAFYAFLFLIITSQSNAQSSGDGSVLEVAEGAPLVVQCSLRPHQPLQWFLNGSTLPDAMRIAAMQHEDTAASDSEVVSRLEWGAAAPHHAGRYTCTQGSDAPYTLVRVLPRSRSRTRTGPSASDVTLSTAATLPITVPTAPTPVPSMSMEVKDVIYEVSRELELTCDLPRSDGQSVIWTKNNTNIINDRVKYLKEGTVLKYEGKSQEDDYGEYMCRVGEKNQKFNVQGRTRLKLPANSNVVEGQNLRLTCKLTGKPYSTVHWFFSNETLKDVDVTELMGHRAAVNVSDQGVENGELLLQEVLRSDAGNYTCHVYTPFMENSTTTVRVKDKYAALWPFLGICIEVFVLCTIILVYEKRRTKPELDDSDTDNHDQKKS